MTRCPVPASGADSDDGPEGDLQQHVDDIVVVRSTVLIVEDNARVLELMSEILSGHYDVIEAPDAETAMSLAAATANLDIILSDVNLPGIDGPELVDLLRTARPELPVVFMSALDVPAGITAADRTEFLVKPFGSELLLDTLRTLLDDD